MDEQNDDARGEVTRRSFLAGAGAVGLGAAAATVLAGCGSSNRTVSLPTPTPTPATVLTDADIFNFALNFEYLGASYYSRALTGSTLSASDTGTSTPSVIGGRQVTFATPYIQEIAQQFFNDELSHVRAIRSVLGSAAVPQPTIDLTNSFNALAVAAGIGSSFDPFLNEDTFLLGAMIFEDVDVTAFIGAAPLLTSATNLAYAGSILGTEAYHGGTLRTLIYNLGNSAYTLDASKVAILREKLGAGSEQQLTGTTIVPADTSTSIIAGRTTGQVLRIAYGTTTSGATSGGFFPNGLNGKIRAAS